MRGAQISSSCFQCPVHAWYRGDPEAWAEIRHRIWGSSSAVLFSLRTHLHASWCVYPSCLPRVAWDGKSRFNTSILASPSSQRRPLKGGAPQTRDSPHAGCCLHGLTLLPNLPAFVHFTETWGCCFFWFVFGLDFSDVIRGTIYWLKAYFSVPVAECPHNCSKSNTDPLQAKYTYPRSKYNF